jgi:hypothetical protein
VWRFRSASAVLNELLLRKCRIAAKLPEGAVFRPDFPDSSSSKMLAAHARFVF